MFLRHTRSILLHATRNAQLPAQPNRSRPPAPPPPFFPTSPMTGCTIYPAPYPYRIGRSRAHVTGGFHPGHGGHGSRRDRFDRRIVYSDRPNDVGQRRHLVYGGMWGGGEGGREEGGVFFPGGVGGGGGHTDSLMKLHPSPTYLHAYIHTSAGCLGFRRDDINIRQGDSSLDKQTFMDAPC